MSYTYNKHAISFIAGIMRLPVWVKWLVFFTINLTGLVRIALIYRKAWKRAEKGEGLETIVLIMAVRVLFQLTAAGILCLLFGILSDMPVLSGAEAVFIPLLSLSLFLLDTKRKKGLIKRMLGGKQE